MKFTFRISEEGESLVNEFYGIGDMDASIEAAIDDLEDVIPKAFIPIADDSGGNQICIGVSGAYIGKIYFWIHDREQKNDMDNMYFLSDNFTDFFNNLYKFWNCNRLEKV